ncbi:hypothetical protein, partial [Acetobacter tropicalis]
MYKKILLASIFLIISDTSYSQSLIDNTKEDNLIVLTKKNRLINVNYWESMKPNSVLIGGFLDDSSKYINYNNNGQL